MAKDIKKRIKHHSPRRYLTKDFNHFRQDLLDYARTYFPDKIQDFSDASVGGMFLDFAAFVGDSLSFYLDHQFNELSVETAVETKNVEKLLRSSGVKIKGASPSVVNVEFYIEVEAEISGGKYLPKLLYLPVIKEGTLVSSTSGITFELTEDLVLSEKVGGLPRWDYVINTTDDSGNPSTFIVKGVGKCTSGQRRTETFGIPDTAVPFRTISLKTQNVTDIVSVSDSQGNRYYEVDSLTQDVVYKRVANLSEDREDVSENIELLPAPYRFTSFTSRKSLLTTLRFGSGQENVLDDDIIPDPSELALPLYGKKTFSRFTLDPNTLLETQTLGISPRNTTVSVTYRSGGGLDHNVDSDTIKSISSLRLKFAIGTPAATASAIRASISVSNSIPARGGEDPPSLTELRSIALGFKNSQSRVVTKQDLIARLYTMPTNFGRIFRVGISSNRNNPMATTLHVLSRNKKGQLVTSPDTLKRNIRTYINDYRLISDAIDIVDGRVVNVGVRYKIVVDAFSNTQTVVQNANTALKSYLKIENFQIGEPLFISDLQNIIINTDGVSSVSDVKLINRFGVKDERIYSTTIFDMKSNTQDNILIAPEGTIFEVRFPDEDIMGTAS